MQRTGGMLALNLAESVDNSRRNRIRLEDLTIVAGGQTGAPRAAIDFAIARHIPHAAWHPQDGEGEDAPIGARRKQHETPSADHSQRTEWNVRGSDGTVVFTISNHRSADSLEALKFAQRHKKPWIHLYAPTDEDAPARLWKFIQDNNIRALNVVGAGAGDDPELEKYVTATLHGLFNPRSILVVQKYNPYFVGDLLRTRVAPKCEVRAFSDPRQALQWFAADERRPGLLVTGLVLEGMRWDNLVRECRKLKPTLKVLVYSAALASRADAHFQNDLAKPDAWVAKLVPDEFEILLAETQNLLGLSCPTP